MNSGKELMLTDKSIKSQMPHICLCIACFSYEAKMELGSTAKSFLKMINTDYKQ
jgi:hypothetical protein